MIKKIIKNLNLLNDAGGWIPPKFKREFLNIIDFVAKSHTFTFIFLVH